MALKREFFKTGLRCRNFRDVLSLEGHIKVPHVQEPPNFLTPIPQILNSKPANVACPSLFHSSGLRVEGLWLLGCLWLLGLGSRVFGFGVWSLGSRV